MRFGRGGHETQQDELTGAPDARGAAAASVQATGTQVRRDRRIRVSDLYAPRTLFMVAVAALTLLGLVMVFSASSIELLDDGGSPYQELRSQATFILLGLIAAGILVRVRYQFWLTKAIVVLWAIVVVMLVATLLVGTEGLGAQRWLYIGPIGIQPSEFAKILVIMVAARIVTAFFAGELRWQRFLLMIALGVVLPFVLILLEKDLGTLIILAATLICMLLLTDCPRWVILLGCVLLVGGAAILIFTAGYRSSRFASWLLDPFDYTNTDNYYGQGWQVRHSLYAFASGGFFGVGLGNSRQKYSYLPEAENDFVFAVIGEELGLLGTLSVVGLFCLLGWAGLRIAREAPDEAGKLLAGGLTCCILIQALVNMCGVLRILPLTGRPLPFISAGGSSMLTTYIMVGLILSVANVTRLEARETAARRERSRANLRLVTGGAAQSPSAERRGTGGAAGQGRTNASGAARGQGRPRQAPTQGRAAPGARERERGSQDAPADEIMEAVAQQRRREGAGRSGQAPTGARDGRPGRDARDPQTEGEAPDGHRGDSGRRNGRSHQPGAGAGGGAARPRP